MLRFLMMVAAAGVLAGCSSSGPDCSADNVIATVKKLGRQKLQSLPGLMYVFDFESSKYEVNAIRTQSRDKKQAICAAEFRFVPELSKGLKKIRESDPDKFASLVSNNYREAQTKELKAPIEYKAEVTDRGDDVYVTVRGL